MVTTAFSMVGFKEGAGGKISGIGSRQGCMYVS